MTRRLSLAGQLLALQVVIICVVLIGVAAVTVAQTIQGAHEVEGRRALAAGEFVANARTTRDAIDDGGVRYLRVVALSTRTAFDAAAVTLVDEHLNVLASSDADLVGGRFALGESTVLTGRPTNPRRTAARRASPRPRRAPPPSSPGRPRGCAAAGWPRR